MFLHRAAEKLVWLHAQFIAFLIIWNMSLLMWITTPFRYDTRQKLYDNNPKKRNQKTVDHLIRNSCVTLALTTLIIVSVCVVSNRGNFIIQQQTSSGLIEFQQIITGIVADKNSRISELQQEIDALGKRSKKLEQTLNTLEKRKPFPTNLENGNTVQKFQQDLNDVRQYIEEDGGLGVDFALRSLGASAVFFRSTRLSLFSNQTPNFALDRDMSPGHCWGFKGNSGKLVVRLPAFVNITSFTIDHNFFGVSGHTSAPKDVEVIGLDKNFEPVRVLAKFMFSLNKPTQQFAIFSGLSDHSFNETMFRNVMLVVKSNYGAAHTCVYRFRVHGLLAEKQEFLSFFERIKNSFGLVFLK